MTSFWSWYSRVLAIIAPIGVAWLFWKAASSSQEWWTSPATVALVTALLGAIAPCTALVSSWAKIQLDAQRQAHDMAEAAARQQHEINTDYLGRALDPSVPLALRHQLLRFLSTPANKEGKLERWAAVELKRLDPVIESLSRDAERAYEKVLGAKTERELMLAERELKNANARLGSGSEPRRKPPVTAAAVKAGFFAYKDLGPLDFSSEDLSMGRLQGCKIAGSSFANANLHRFSLHDSDARGANFDGADLTQASMSEADLRGATFRNTNLRGADLKQARLEGANLSGATLPDVDVGATYDSRTIWPEGFDPKRAGCVALDDGVGVEPPKASMETGT